MSKIIKNGLEYGDTSLPSGGEKDQVLAKKSSLDNDVEWKDTGLSTEDWSDIMTPLPGQPTEGIIISPEERQVGWYYNMNGDGTKKPLYQKIVIATTGNCTELGTGVDTFTPIGASVESFISVIGVMDINGAFQNTNSSFLYGTKTAFVACVGRTNNFSGDTHVNCIHLRNAMPGFSGYTCYIIVQYTKTTDTYA